ADRHVLLLRLLHHHHAAARPDRNAAAPAELDHRGGAFQAEDGGGTGDGGNRGLRHSLSGPPGSREYQAMNSILKGLAAFGLAFATALGAAQAAEEEGGTPHYPLVNPTQESWSFSGPFGTYDRAQLQRGFKVYREA